MIETDLAANTVFYYSIKEMLIGREGRVMAVPVCSITVQSLGCDWGKDTTLFFLVSLVLKS